MLQVEGVAPPGLGAQNVVVEPQLRASPSPDSPQQIAISLGGSHLTVRATRIHLRVHTLALPWLTQGGRSSFRFRR